MDYINEIIAEAVLEVKRRKLRKDDPKRWIIYEASKIKAAKKLDQLDASQKERDLAFKALIKAIGL